MLIKKFRINYEPSSFVKSDGKIDINTLRSKITGLFVGVFVEYNGIDVVVSSDSPFSQEKAEKIDSVIAEHTGIPLDILIKDTSNNNRLILQNIISTAINRPDLAPYSDSIVNYYTCIGSMGILESFVYFGKRGLDLFINQIIKDVQEVSLISQIPIEERTIDQTNRYDLLSILLLEVTAPSELFPNGVKAYEFIIDKISKPQ